MRAACWLAQLSQNFLDVDGALPHLTHSKAVMRAISRLRALFFQLLYMHCLHA